jgi:peptide/nickel transport system substrate-binding protein
MQRTKRGPLQARPIGVLAAVLVAASPLAACAGNSGAGDSGGTPSPGGDLVIATQADIPTLDKDKAAASNQAIRVDENVFGRLYELGPDSTPVPSLATGYTVSDDKLAWTFALRDNAKFSNGSPITAQDVVFSLDLARKGDSFGSLYSVVTSVEAPDARTVVIKLNKPAPTLLDILTLFTSGVIPNNYAGQSEAAFWQSPIASGAWKVDSYAIGQVCKLVPNPNYWGAKPYLNSASFTLVPNANTRVLQLRNGQAQLVETPPQTELQSLRAGGTTVITAPSTEADDLVLNTSKPPFNDVHFRRAFSLAIDRASIVKAAVAGNGSPIGTFMTTPALGGYQPPNAATFDIAAAKAELAQSATPTGASVTLLYNPKSSPAYAATAQIIQQNLSALGVTVTPQAADGNVMSGAIKGKTYDFSMAMGTYDVPDPGENVSYYLQTNGYRSYLPPGNIKDLFGQASTEPDAAKRLALYKQIDDQLAANADVVALFTVPWTYGASTKLHGMSVIPTGQYDLSKLWLSH